MKLINDNELKKKTKELVTHYLDRGLGGYSGKELEILILDFVLSVYPTLADMTLFEKSRELQASESKIKNMLYEIKLRSDDDIKELIAVIENDLKSSEFEKGRLILEIDDIYCQKRLKSILKEGGFITDSSFNSDLIKIPYEGFITIIAELFPSKKDTLAFKDMIATKKLAQTNRNIIGSIGIPDTDLKLGSVWDLATSLTTSVKSAIVSKKEEIKKSIKDKKVAKNKKK